MLVPDAVKFATVAELQKSCEADPVGAVGVLIVMVTANLLTLSHPNDV
jgi:hypothetical protein